MPRSLGGVSAALLALATGARGACDSAQLDAPGAAEADARERCWTFELAPGEAYVLSGAARNECDHGVLCLHPRGRRSENAAGVASRESLNLRFGLHPWRAGAECSAYKEVYHQFEPPAPPKAPKRAKKATGAPAPNAEAATAEAPTAEAPTAAPVDAAPPADAATNSEQSAPANVE